MATKQLPELAFRHYLGPKMAPYWRMTWHEDREISPGVPDCHYVMRGLEPHRVGWLELKALSTEITKSQRIKVKPSQRQYFREWEPHMPMHFLIRIKEQVFLIGGHLYGYLPEIENTNDLRLASIVSFHQSEIANVLPPVLSDLTVYETIK